MYMHKIFLMKSEISFRE